MNTLAISLMWCTLQVSAFSVLGTITFLALRRRGPAPGAWIASCVLGLLVLVSVFSFSPWLRLWSLPSQSSHDTRTDRPGESHRGPSDSRPSLADQAKSAAEVRSARTNSADTGLTWSGFWEQFERASARQTASRVPWGTWGLGVLCACVVFGLLRLSLGLAAVRRYRKHTVPLTDRKLLELVDELRAAMSCLRRVELRESRELVTPATVGWRAAIVLLPNTWREWTDQERRVVLAHEIAHVQRGDYASWILAQLSLAVHFYHPLVHWLVGRLRVEQELAADALGAEYSGGRAAYLVTLAEMALRQDDRGVSWAVRPFLPRRGTFLGRIEMLRDPKWFRSGPLGTGARMVILGLLACAGLALAGVRLPDGKQPSAAQAALPGDERAEAAGFDLQYVPAEAVLVACIRPSALSKLEGADSLANFINTSPGLEKQLGMPLQEIEEVKVVISQVPGPRNDGGRQPLGGPIDRIVLRSVKPHDWKTLVDRLVPNAIVAEFRDQKYYKPKNGAPDQPSMCYFLADERTIVLASETVMLNGILSPAAANSEPKWSADWKRVSGGHVAVMVNATAFYAALAPMLNSPDRPRELAGMLAFLPILEKTDRAYLGIDASKGLGVDLYAVCGSAENAQQVGKTIEALFTLGKNVLEKMGNQVANQPDRAAEPILMLADLGAEALKQGKLQVSESTVYWKSQVELDFGEVASSILTPAVTAARDAAQRSQSMNNLRQIALAMHNYHDTHGHFPPAAVVGPDGKTLHSWRVELLPFLEAQPLYESYKQDEPWDSEHNKQVLAKMPSVFRDPHDGEDSTDSSYYVLTGKATVFAKPTGTRFQDITDGTSNTILTVEAKRSIPWTKPEDIEYDPAKPLPELGGRYDEGFLTGFADGSVHFLAKSVTEANLRAMVTMAGGEVVLIQ